MTDRPMRGYRMSANLYYLDRQSTTKTSNNKARKNRKQMRSNPEQVLLDTKYEDIDASGTLALDHEPTNAKFHTDRVLLWKDATLNYYIDFHVTVFFYNTGI